LSDGGGELLDLEIAHRKALVELGDQFGETVGGIPLETQEAAQSTFAGEVAEFAARAHVTAAVGFDALGVDAEAIFPHGFRSRA